MYKQHGNANKPERGRSAGKVYGVDGVVCRRVSEVRHLREASEFCLQKEAELRRVRGSPTSMKKGASPYISRLSRGGS